MRQRGSALLEVLSVGFLAVLFVGQALVTVGRLAAAGDAAASSAHAAAVIWADGGDPEAAVDTVETQMPNARVVIVDAAESVTVEVVIDVSVVGPASGPVTIAVRGKAIVPRSPYRSGP